LNEVKNIPSQQKGYKITNPEGIYFITFAVVEWIDVFTRKDYAEVVVDSLKYCQKEKGLVLYAGCLMSNHLHMICAAKDGYNLSDILRDFKKYTSLTILNMIEESKRESRRNWMLWIFRSKGEKNRKNTTYQFWQQNNHPKELLTNKFMQEKLEYIHNNPVSTGIVSRPEDYVWSSARNYSSEMGVIEVEFLE
jgi:putative transposase